MLSAAAAPGAAITWDDSAGTLLWSVAANWSGDAEPSLVDDVLFPSSLSGSITLGTGELAKSLQFDGGFTLTGGGLSLAAGSRIGVATGVTAFVQSGLETTGMLTKDGAGGVTLSGNNNHTGGLSIDAGTLEFSTDASWDDPASLYVAAPGSLYVSGLSHAISVANSGFISIFGLIAGDVETMAYFEGNGTIDGNLDLLTGGQFYPALDGQFHVTGDLTLDVGGLMDFTVDGASPQTDHDQIRVGGAVALDGDLNLDVFGSFTEGTEIALILNDGTDPILGEFNGLPEGAKIPIGNGLAFQISYEANADGGAVANDFGATVVPESSGVDLRLTAASPVAVDLGAEIILSLVVSNNSASVVNDATISVNLPANATFISSSPAGTVNAGVLSVSLPSIGANQTSTVALHLTAPSVSSAVAVLSGVSSSITDPLPGNNDYYSLIAVLPDAVPRFSGYAVDTVTDQVTLGISTINNIHYVLEASTDLHVWNEIERFTGDGQPRSIVQALDEDDEFFRIGITPQSGELPGPQ